MIAYVRGTVAEKEPTRVVIEAGGVGYELLIPISTYEKLPRTGSETKLLAYHCVREDDEILFGFATTDEREMFLKLTSVSGVGPKIALAILSGSSVGELSMAIVGGDAKRIAAIKGVGKKTAEKICVELRDLSGGQIENIVRKINIEYILSGNVPSVEEILRKCGEERISSDAPGKRRIGFPVKSA